MPFKSNEIISRKRKRHAAVNTSPDSIFAALRPCDAERELRRGQLRHRDAAGSRAADPNANANPHADSYPNAHSYAHPHAKLALLHTL